MQNSSLAPAWLARGAAEHDAHVSELIATVARLEGRLRALTQEREALRHLLEQSDAALKKAGVPYAPGNIRESISAYQVFSSLPRRGG